MTMPTQTNASQTSSLSIAGNHKPFNLFGLTGERGDLIQRAWYGEPEDKPADPFAFYTKFDVLVMWICWLSFGLLLLVFGTEDGLFRTLNFHPTWEKQTQDILSIVWILTGSWLLLRSFLPGRERRERDAEEKRKRQQAKQKNSLTLELYSPQTDGRRPKRVENENQPVMMRRNRQSPAVQLGRLRPASKFVVTLEGLTSAEQEKLFGAYLRLGD